MTGRVYCWRGGYWRVVTRWASPRPDDVTTFACLHCGHTERGVHRDLRSDRDGAALSYCLECGNVGQRVHAGSPRNVLIERVVALGGGAGGPLPRALWVPVSPAERLVRPFRGLRRIETAGGR